MEEGDERRRRGSRWTFGGGQRGRSYFLQLDRMRKRKERDEEVEGKMEGWIRMARFLLVLLFNLPPYSTVRAEACRRRLPSLSSYRQASAKLQEVRLFPRHSSITSRKMHRKVSQPSWANIPSQKGQLLSFHLIPLNPPFSISLPFLLSSSSCPIKSRH